MAKKIKEPINLLPQEEFAASTLGRVLTWLLSTFRMIVIATEMVVMAAFLSRFWLDARNTDLNDEMKQKSAIIASYKDIETNFRSAQKKLTIFSSLTSAPNNNVMIGTMTADLPSAVFLSTISLTGTTLQIAGTGDSEESISQFIANLGAQSSFKNMKLTQIGSDKTGGGLNFTINGSIAK